VSPPSVVDRLVQAVTRGTTVEDDPGGGATLELSHLFAVPPARVWPHISEAALLSAWGDVEITPISPGPSGLHVEAGARRRVAIPVGPSTVVAEEVLLEVSPPGRFVYRVVEGGGLRYHLGTITLAPTLDGGTELSWTVRLVPRMPGFGSLIVAALRPQFDRGFALLAEELARCAD